MPLQLLLFFCILNKNIPQNDSLTVSNFSPSMLSPFFVFIFKVKVVHALVQIKISYENIISFHLLSGEIF